MKILAISHSYPVPYDKFNGIAIHKLIKELVNQGCEVRVISPQPWTPFPINRLRGEWHHYSKVPEKMEWDDIKVYYPRYLTFPKALFSASSGTRMYYGIRGTISKIYSDFPFDIIHAHMALPDGFSGMLLSQRYDKRLVLTFRGTDMVRKHRAMKSTLKAFRQADRIFTPSPHLQELAKEQLGVNSTVIPNGVDPREIFEGESELEQRYEGKYVILSVSRLLRSKGIDLNMGALRRLKKDYGDLHYIIVGDGPERERLQKLAENLTIKNSVEFIGWQSHHKAMEYMSICDIFSLPSWQETFGLVYLEAMAQGKPIIGCRGQGVDGIVKEGETGLLAKPKDIDSLVEALDFLLGHPEEARAMGERARKLVLENYTWEKNAEKTIKVYEEVLNAC